MRRLFSCSVQLCLCAALLVFCGAQFARAEVASIYGGSDGLCGSRTANGERLDCSAMTAAHRTLPFGTLVKVCHIGCVVVRINDRGPFVRGRHIDLSPAAAHAIGLRQTGQVAMSLEETPTYQTSADRQPPCTRSGCIRPAKSRRRRKRRPVIKDIGATDCSTRGSLAPDPSSRDVDGRNDRAINLRHQRPCRARSRCTRPAKSRCRQTTQLAVRCSCRVICLPKTRSPTA